MTALKSSRVHQLLAAARSTRILVVGDVMLDQFLWGRVARISPEAPVPVVDFVRESFMPGGAANVARNLSALGASCELFGVIGRDHATATQGTALRSTCRLRRPPPAQSRHTSIKTVVAHQQQVVRVDRETA
jgi:D-beta-D-heptose 7-phosphate kinase/D-beta-D-heptose 1-phosphate adenosyltransferase